MQHLARAMSFAEQLHDLREPTRRGRFAHLVQSVQFNLLSLLVIVLNSVYITILTNDELSQPGVQVQPVMALELTYSAFYCLSKIRSQSH